MNIMYHPRLKGSHYEMGKHYGDLLYKTGENLSSVIKLNEEQKLFGERCFPLYENYLKDIMGEVKGFVCQFEKKLNFDTIWSCVYDLNSLYSEICEGNPSKTKYKVDNRLEWGLKQNKK